MTHGTNWPARQTLYGDTAGRAGIAYCGTSYATAPQQSARQPRTRYQARTGTGQVARRRTMVMTVNHEDLPARLKHEGVRVGEIIAYRAWRVLTLISRSSGKRSYGLTKIFTGSLESSKSESHRQRPWAGR